MQPPFPAPVPTWHNAVYPAIDPATNPKTHSERTVVITGAGSGIGRATAQAFSLAGAKRIVLIGRTASTLAETKALIAGPSEILTYIADVSDEGRVAGMSKEIGTWDVLVLNAGYFPNPSYVVSSEVEDYWKAYETNLKPIIFFAKYFFPNAASSGAAALSITSGAMTLPTKTVVGVSAYLNSKLAAVKMMEFLALENPNIFCASIHPGMVDTAMYRKGGATPETVPTDDVKLSGAFLVWSTLPEAKFLNGKFVWANWDVDELKAKAEEIANGTILTAGIEGWPFATS